MNLNEGRDLRKECKEVVLDSLAKAEPGDGYRIMEAVEPWIGMLDNLFTSLRKYPGKPIRPDGPFLGFSDAIAEIDPETTDLQHLITLLSISFSNQARIPEYERFFDRIESRLKVTDPSRYRKLLKGFYPK
jgi:hypothetical protein